MNKDKVKTDTVLLAAKVVEALKLCYPAATCALRYEGEPWKLLVMGRLSAQCTDKRVNEVSVPLFARYPTPGDMAEAEIGELEEIVRPCGLYHVKASDLRAECRLLVGEYGGVLPSGMDELLRFPGVGRKIANLLRGDIFGLPAIVADTHCIRLAGRIGFCDEGEKDPLRVERALSAAVKPDEQSDFCHRLVLLGREICTARKPLCDNCRLAALCRHCSGMRR